MYNDKVARFPAMNPNQVHDNVQRFPPGQAMPPMGQGMYAPNPRPRIDPNNQNLEGYDTRPVGANAWMARPDVGLFGAPLGALPQAQAATPPPAQMTDPGFIAGKMPAALGALTGQPQNPGAGRPMGMSNQAGRIPRAPQSAQGQFNQNHAKEIAGGNRLDFEARQKFEQMRKQDPNQAAAFKTNMLGMYKANPTIAKNAAKKGR